MSNNANAMNFFDDELFEGLEIPAPQVKPVPVQAAPVTQIPVQSAQVAAPVQEIVADINIESVLSGKSEAEIVAMAQGGVVKLRHIEAELNDMFVEREHVIKDSLRALAIKQNLLLLGPPGTAKTAFAKELCSRIDMAQFFAWLLNRTSDPAEILGPYSIKAMEKDRFLRKTEGKLPEAHIAFIDEIYKSNEPTLNILLPLLNEKVFYNDGKAVKVPLVTLFGASNEEPEDESLKALHDRLIFRIWVDYVKDPSNRAKMHESYVAKRNGKQLVSSRTTITLEELEAINYMAGNVPVPKSVFKTFAKLLNVLEKHGIIISDRRQNECYKIMQGNAALHGRPQVVLDDLGALKSVLWEERKDIQFIESEIDKLINPFDDEVKTLFKKSEEIRKHMDSITDANDRCGAAIEAKGRLEDIIKKFDKTIKEASANGKDVTDMAKKRDAIIAYNQNLMQEALGLNLAGLGADSPF